MPGDHALLSPSGASRWLVCTPSAVLGKQFPETAGQAADEGTLAHELGELIINFKLDRITKQKYNIEFKRIKSNPLYDASMLGYCTDYAVYVLERFYEIQEKDSTAEIEVEKRTDLTAFIPESFGTRDISIKGAGLLIVIDFKYGKGVLVDAEDNPQMKVYALGALSEHLFNIAGGVNDPVTVEMIIYQPRIDNISTFKMDVWDLYKWSEEVLIPTARIAFKGEGDFVPGKHCQFCKVITCKARAEKNLEIARYDFKKPTLLSIEEVADILDRSKDLVSWTGDITEYALKQALAGTTYPGFKLVAGRSNRVVSDEAALRNGLLQEGFKESDIITTKIVPLAALEGLVGKKEFNEKFGGYYVKPTGSPTLAPLSDKRPEFGIASAIADFTDSLEDDIDISDLL